MTGRRRSSRLLAKERRHRESLPIRPPRHLVKNNNGRSAAQRYTGGIIYLPATLVRRGGSATAQQHTTDSLAGHVDTPSADGDIASNSNDATKGDHVMANAPSEHHDDTGAHQKRVTAVTAAFDQVTLGSNPELPVAPVSSEHSEGAPAHVYGHGNSLPNSWAPGPAREEDPNVIGSNKDNGIPPIGEQVVAELLDKLAFILDELVACDEDGRVPTHTYWYLLKIIEHHRDLARISPSLGFNEAVLTEVYRAGRRLPYWTFDQLQNELYGIITALYSVTAGKLNLNIVDYLIGVMKQKPPYMLSGWLLSVLAGTSVLNFDVPPVGDGSYYYSINTPRMAPYPGNNGEANGEAYVGPDPAGSELPLNGDGLLPTANGDRILDQIQY